MSPMLHTKAQGHWPFGSGEEGFWRVFTIYGRGGHLGHVTQMSRTNFRSPDPWRLHMKFGFDWPSGFGKEDLWKWWTDGQRTTMDANGRQTDDGACLYYKLTNEPKGSGELISGSNFNNAQNVQAELQNVQTLIRLLGLHWYFWKSLDK